MTSRVRKLQDFAAHPGGSVHCARFGEKSGQVFATGGDDKKVNIWGVNKPNSLMTLTPHTSSVESLVFDKQEQVLVAGTSGGSMHVWNLEYHKMGGVLPGHRTACTSLECHPYGEFFASGSTDTNLKIWDLRKKLCIQTYRGHTGSIYCIKFSPHGRWVATGGQDGRLKLWDLTVGKLMQDLDLHRGPISSIAFHPREYLMATGSVDKTAKLWSLETFECIGTTEPAHTVVQGVRFHADAHSLLRASQDALHVFPAEAITTPTDAIDVDWREIQDMRLLPEERVMVLSAESSQVRLWVADTRHRESNPTRGPAVGSNRKPAAVGNGSFAKQSSPVVQRVERGMTDHDTDNVSRVGIAPSHSTQASTGFSNDVTDQLDETALPLNKPVHGAANSPIVTAQAPAAVPDLFQDHQSKAEVVGGFSSHSLVGAEDSCASTSQESQRAHPSLSLESISELASKHGRMLDLFNNRKTQAARLKEVWVRGNLANLRTALQIPQEVAHQAVVCDFLRAILQGTSQGVANLDACVILLPIAKGLMGSKYSEFATAALQFAEMLLNQFKCLICDTRQSCANIPARQLDIAREERLRKCDECYNHFREIHELLPESQAASQFTSFRSILHMFLQSC